MRSPDEADLIGPFLAPWFPSDRDKVRSKGAISFPKLVLQKRQLLQLSLSLGTVGIGNVLPNGLL